MIRGDGLPKAYDFRHCLVEDHTLPHKLRVSEVLRLVIRLPKGSLSTRWEEEKQGKDSTTKEMPSLFLMQAGGSPAVQLAFSALVIMRYTENKDSMRTLSSRM
jgi:hypothetical protein